MRKSAFDRPRSPILVFMHDVFMIPVAWVFAYGLQYGALEFSGDNFNFTVLMLPFLLILQSLSYWYFGLYQFALIPR